MSRVAMKFCGITRVEDAWAAADLGAAAIGFVFAPSSRRAVAPDAARAIAATLPPFLQRVGVFVDLPVAEVRQIAAHVGLDAVQLHGRETPADFVAAWPRVIRALARAGDPVVEAASWPASVTLLVDAATGDAPGGTGQLADWPAAATLARQRRLVLAGGLTADNVGEAIRIVRPYAVDVSSGIETRPGEKSVARMRAFARAVDDAWRRDDDGIE
ncbi:MAG: phosphoribosylanthranilate isomerase [Vicinamibacteraceae bacterium]